LLQRIWSWLSTPEQGAQNFEWQEKDSSGSFLHLISSSFGIDKNKNK
jgi:hypothetical protein